MLDEDDTKSFALTLVGIFGYSMRPVVPALLLYIVGPRKNHRWVWALVVGNALIHLTALFSDVCFSIDAANRFHRGGPLGYSCHIVSGILLAHLLALTLREYRRQRKIEALIPVFNAAIIILSVVLDSFVDYREYPVSYLTMAVVVGNVFFYLWLHLQFMREHEEALMAGQRMQLTLSQIKPHFLHNALTVIADLCDRDTQKAKQATVAFSQYLRGNMESLDEHGAIPIFSKNAFCQLAV